MSLRCLRSLLPSLIAMLVVAMGLFSEMPLLITSPEIAQGQAAERQRDVIVILARGANPRAVARGVKARPTFVYDHIIDGFAATLPPQAIRELENDPAVMAVVPDRPVQAFSVSSAGDNAVAEAFYAKKDKCKKFEKKKRWQQCVKKAKKHDSPSPPAPPNA